jgi:hypothetical protein
MAMEGMTAGHLKFYISHSAAMEWPGGGRVNSFKWQRTEAEGNYGRKTNK